MVEDGSGVALLQASAEKSVDVTDRDRALDIARSCTSFCQNLQVFVGQRMPASGVLHDQRAKPLCKVTIEHLRGFLELEFGVNAFSFRQLGPLLLVSARW